MGDALILACTWVDQKVLKLLAYLLEYTMEVFKSYTEYKVNISWFRSDVWMSQYAKINVTSSFDDVMQQWPGPKKWRKFFFPSKEQWPTLMCRLESIVFRLKRFWLSIIETTNSLDMQFWNF